MTSPQPTYRTTLGVSKETTYGTAVTASNFIPVTTLTPADKLDLLKDTAMRGSAVESYGHVPGPIFANLDFAGPVFADGIGWPVVGVLGDITVTGAGAPFTTAASLLNTGTTQPPSYTLTVLDAINALQFPGMKFSEVAFKFDGAGLLEYSAKAVGLTSAIQGSPPTPSFTTVPIEAAWTGVAQIAGSSTGVQLVSGEVNIKRAVDPINTVDGSQAPFTCWSGPLAVDGKCTLVMLADTYRAQYVAGTAAALDFNFQQGAGAAATQVKLHMTNATFTDALVNFGKSYIELEITFEADANVTDAGASLGYSPIKVTLQNAIASGTYK